MARVLLTGAAGFLGSHLCDRLLAERHQLTGIDNLSTGSLENLSHLESHPDFRFVTHDVRDPIDLGTFDIVMNFACPASPPTYQLDPVGTARTCFQGTLNSLEVARRDGARFMQASTSEVYGDPTVHPQPETYRGTVNPIGPRACYDEGKRVGETLCFDYHRQYGLEMKVIRIFNTYGPRMNPDDGRVVSNFVVQALLGHDITIFGEGEQTRSFCFVDDLVDGIMRMLNSQSGFTGPVNLGNPEEFTIRELAEIVIEMTGSQSRIVYRPLPTDDPRQRRPTIDMAQQELKWSPSVRLREGLSRTIEYFDNVLSRRSAA